MKKLLSLSLVLTFAFTSLFANIEVGQEVMESFKKEFANAEEVKWESARNLSKATFKLNSHIMVAYFTAGGELVAVTRNLLVKELPIVLQSSFTRNYPQSWVTDLFEVSAGGETSYYLTLHTATHITVVKSVGTSGWETFKKEKKKLD